MTETIKIFRYVSKNKRTPHLYAETSKGQKIPLCRFAIDDAVAASQILSFRGDECATCKGRAEDVFRRQLIPVAKDV